MIIAKTVQTEVYVAPCLECGSRDIRLEDYGYSSHNLGGGTCGRCGHEVYEGVGCLPEIDQMIAIWNAANDIDTLIRAEESKIVKAEEKIAILKAKALFRAGSGETHK